MGFLIAIFARLGLPEPLRRMAALVTAIIAAALLCGTLWTCWLSNHDDAVVERHEQDVKEAVATESAAASGAASEAVADTKGKVDRDNDEARKAAAGSDDPLKSGLDRLRGN